LRRAHKYYLVSYDEFEFFDWFYFLYERWKRDISGNKVVDQETNKNVLQFVSIQRLDTREWAIPGGMCDPGEHVSVTLKREFMEEATDCLGCLDGNNRV